MSNYSSMLRDPRWQKKRLKVLERDGWCCQSCYDSGSTLHVHHKYYEKGKKPWEYPLKAFVTLCETCHDEEKENREKEENLLIRALKEYGFMSSDINALAIAFHELDSGYPPEVTATIIAWALSKHTFDTISGVYFASLREHSEKSEK